MNADAVTTPRSSIAPPDQADQADQSCCSCNITDIVIKVGLIALAIISLTLNFYVTGLGILIGIATINPKDPDNVINRISHIWNHFFGHSWWAKIGGAVLTATFAFYFIPWSIVAGYFSIGAYSGYRLSAEANN